MSDNSTSGVLVVSASSTSLPLSNVVQLKPAPGERVQALTDGAIVINDRAIPRCINTSTSNRQVHREFGMSRPTGRIQFARVLIDNCGQWEAPRPVPPSRPLTMG